MTIICTTDLRTDCVGVGKTPEEAMQDFITNEGCWYPESMHWYELKPKKVRLVCEDFPKQTVVKKPVVSTKKVK